MFTYVDAVYARMRHEEMLKEADRRRLIARVTAQHPSILKRTATALKQSLAALRANQPSNKHLAKLTLDLSVQKLTCVHRAQINSE